MDDSAVVVRNIDKDSFYTTVSNYASSLQMKYRKHYELTELNFTRKKCDYFKTHMLIGDTVGMKIEGTDRNVLPCKVRDIRDGIDGTKKYKVYCLYGKLRSLQISQD